MFTLILRETGEVIYRGADPYECNQADYDFWEEHNLWGKPYHTDIIYDE